MQNFYEVKHGEEAARAVREEEQETWVLLQVSAALWASLLLSLNFLTDKTEGKLKNST